MCIAVPITPAGEKEVSLDNLTSSGKLRALLFMCCHLNFVHKTVQVILSFIKVLLTSFHATFA